MIIRGPDHWHTAFDCSLMDEIVFWIIPHVLPADNPQQSETCSHIGLKGNLFCRHCKAGGPDEQRESDAGYEALFLVCFSFLSCLLQPL